MTLRKGGSPRAIAARRDRMLQEAEAKVEEATDAAMRQFLRRLQAQVTPDSLAAAGAEGFPRSVNLFTLGQAHDWWEDAVDEHVVSAVRSVWRAGYFDTRDGELVQSSLQAAEDHIAHVTDRLSRTATPTIPERAMDTARVALSDEMARGSSIQETSKRLATEFGWDDDATFWRGRLSEVDDQLDAILDSYGQPGDRMREAVRTGRTPDPQVEALQQQRSQYVQRIDRTESEWATRAERIARTETTGAYNAGSLDAAEVEGAGVKVWIATADDRTRDEHLDASGQCVPVHDSFDVGGTPLQMPADPSGPPELTINCRCTIVYADTCAEAGGLYSDVDDVMDRERTRRDDG